MMDTCREQLLTALIWAAMIVGLFTTSTTPAADTRPAPAAPTSARAEAPAATPREALRSLNLAQRDGDAPAMRSLFLTDDEDGANLISAMADYSAALVALHKAAEKAYGVDGANLVTGDIKAQSAEGLTAIEKAEIALDGDKASVKYVGATDPPVQLVKVEGRWKLPLTQMLGGVDKTAERQRFVELTHQARLTNQMAKELGNGLYREGPSHAAAVWRARLLDPVTTRPNK